MSSPTQGMWVCRHGVDGRDYCPECYSLSPDQIRQRTENEQLLLERWDRKARELVSALLALGMVPDAGWLIANDRAIRLAAAKALQEAYDEGVSDG